MALLPLGNSLGCTIVVEQLMAYHIKGRVPASSTHSGEMVLEYLHKSVASIAVARTVFKWPRADGSGLSRREVLHR